MCPPRSCRDAWPAGSSTWVEACLRTRAEQVHVLAGDGNLVPEGVALLVCDPRRETELAEQREELLLRGADRREPARIALDDERGGPGALQDAGHPAQSRRLATLEVELHDVDSLVGR